ncbi:MAG: Hsp20/alpha crystallin family protein [Haloarculaceae archaeon]
MTDRRDPFEDIEELIDAVTGGMGPGMSPGTGGRLPVDVADAGDAFVVVADLPGYDADDIDVTLSDDTTLSIAAERETGSENEYEDIEGAERYVTRERRRESVNRRVGLPEPVEEGEAGASFDGGVLTVTLPKRGGGDGTDIPVE